MEEQSMDDIKANVEIADRTGHSSLSLTKQETLDLIEGNQGSWIYQDNQMVQAKDLAAANWGDIGTIRIMPGLTGGL
jgi:hypothetical protein